MSRKKTFSQNLIHWYKKNARDLPWRKTKNPYKIWISEIMLQQTTVNAVISYYEKWVKTFPTVERVAKAKLHKILRLWQGLGYYSRARNIHKASKIIVKDFNGQIPSEIESLRKLPGFGPYTVGAVLSIAFDKRVPIIDANVRRVVMRQLAIKGHADTSQDKKILEFLNTIMPLKGNNIFNQALMELGALICRNKTPLCLACPVRKSCLVYEKGIQEIIPIPKEKNLRDLNVAVAVIQKNGRYFIQKRPSNGLLGDLWEFPGGKIEKGESAKDALLREIKEEVGTEIIQAEYLMNIKHFYTQYRVHLHVFKCFIKSHLIEDNAHKWVTFNEFSQYPMPSGSVKIVEGLRS